MEPTSPTQAASPRHAPDTLGRARLLLVDDEPAVLRVLRVILGRHYELVAEQTAQAALKRIVGGERFDLIISDVMMPGMTGKQFLEALVPVAPAQAARLVFLTGGATTPGVREFLTTTKQRVITKPFDGNDLLAFIDRHVRAQVQS